MNCECGCGREVNEGRRFVYGHNGKGLHNNVGCRLSEKSIIKRTETRRKNGWLKNPELTKQKMRDSKINSEEYKNGEFQHKVSESLIEYYKHPNIESEKERRKNIRKSLIGVSLSEERRKNMRQPRTLKHRQNISKGMKGNIKVIEAHMGKKQSLETIEKRTDAFKRTVNAIEWKETKGKEKSEKLVQTMNDCVWKETRGTQKIEKMKAWRKTFICPIKDTIPELIIQGLLTLLHKEYIVHKYMNIEHGYQCDIMIPIQEGIKQDTIIECDGDYYHGNPDTQKQLKDWQIERRKVDDLRTKELEAKGYRVIRLWESEIKIMNINKFEEILNIYRNERR